MSSCSVYGASGERPSREGDPTEPLTAYARARCSSSRTSRRSPTTRSRRRSCATPRPTARRPGSASTSSSTTSPRRRSSTTRSACRATARRGGRSSTSSTSPRPWPACSSAPRELVPRRDLQRRLGRRRTTRSARSPRSSASSCPAARCSSATPAPTSATTGPTSPRSRRSCRASRASGTSSAAPRELLDVFARIGFDEAAVPLPRAHPHRPDPPPARHRADRRRLLLDGRLVSDRRAPSSLSCRSCGGERPAPGARPRRRRRSPTRSSTRPTPPARPVATRWTIVFCPACALVQLGFALPADAHLRRGVPVLLVVLRRARAATPPTHVAGLIADRGLGPSSFVVEVASNDGYLLRNFVAAGVRAFGIDPSPGPAAAAEAIGVPTIVGFFGVEQARAIVAEHGRADVIVANNVMAHVPDLNDFVGGFAELLADDGIVTVENPYVRDLIEHVEFDTIYHEHYCYFSCSSVDALMSAPRPAPQRRRVLPRPPRRHAAVARRTLADAHRAVRGVPRRRAHGRARRASSTTRSSPSECASASRSCGSCSTTCGPRVARWRPTALRRRERRSSTAPGSAPTSSPTSSTATCTSRAS